MAIRGVGKKERWFGGDEKRFLWTWFGLILLFFSISSSKLIPYIAPVFLPVARLFGHLFRRYEERLEKRETGNFVPLRYRWPGIFQAALFMAAPFVPLFLRERAVAWENWWPWIIAPIVIQGVLIFLPNRVRMKSGRGWFAAIYLLFAMFVLSLTPPVARYLAPYKSAYPLSQAIRHHVPADAMLYQYGMSLYGIDFYTHRRTPIVDDIGEVRYGSEQLPAAERERFFLTSDAFFRLVHATSGIYCATENDEKLERLKKETPGLRVLWHNDAYSLMQLSRS